MVRGGLFSRYFLEEGIRQTDAYRTLDPVAITTFADMLRGRWVKLESMPRASEAETESEFIFPVLDALGWHHFTQPAADKSRRDIADALLFLNEQAKERARRLKAVDRFKHGVVVVENEARDTRLDRASGKGEAPSSQILRYLSRSEIQSDGAVRWGLLTNGRFWRLYWAQARARAEGFVEFELTGLIGPTPPVLPAGAPDDHWLRTFLVLFRRDALEPLGPDRHTFLDEALAEGRRYEERATAALSEAVFNRVFPELVAAIARYDPQVRIDDATWRAEAREAALRLLYRLLFLLYAEDRDLLPVRHPKYERYSLFEMRNEAAKTMDGATPLSARMVTWWPNLRALFSAIADGDTGMGLPPYNGSLFRDEPGGLLLRANFPDAVLAPLLDAMSREGPAGARRYINYRDLSVQQLGSIYERLLERDLVPDGAGGVELRPNPFARKTSGSYYTPDELVQLILRQAVGPLLDERRQAFQAKADALKHDRRPKAERIRELSQADAATAFIGLRVCDPAMGSGHFLVSLVDYLAAAVLDAIADAPKVVTWADDDAPYRSPLAERIETLRTHIRAAADANGWEVRDEHLDDRHLVRRIILKRVIYGVDLNPMAVELAKLSLWLHSFTVGAPLSFLDHHLRCGDSLFGEFVWPVEEDLRRRFGLVMSQAVVRARNSATGMRAVEDLTDSDIGEVQTSASTFAGVEEATAELRAFLNIYHAARWLPADDKAGALARDEFFGGNYGDPAQIAAGTLKPRGPKEDKDRDQKLRQDGKVPPIDAFRAFTNWINAGAALGSERRFLPWEAAFPGVWDNWESPTPSGGFDAVIGNPPWDRIKMQEVEWFSARVPAIAHAQRASDRKKMIAALQKKGDPVAADYARASWVAEAAASVAREGGAYPPPTRRGGGAAAARRERTAYPLLGGGDANLYALFVERAGRIVKPDGMVGLLVPSGIAADAGAAAFFKSVSTTGRLRALLDFENGKRKPEPFFPDVHRSFKFCALVLGGKERTFLEARCAFFQQDALVAEAHAFALSPADFAAVNPNTGTAPVFRTPRDVDITRSIYKRLPVLVDRRQTPPEAVWPVRYSTMFHMTNDSNKFRTAAELTKLGAYRVQGGCWEKGTATWLPLMTGRSINHFDHRAASVTVNADNLHNPFNSELTTLAQHADPSFVPAPQFWVSDNDIEWPADLEWGLSFRDIARVTDARTVIATLVPRSAFGNTAPLLLTENDVAAIASYKAFAPLLAANLCSLALDFVARQKVQSTHLNYYILEQLPLVPPAIFKRRFGPRTAEKIIRDDVLHLTYTAHDMEAFARDQGFAGPPFAWDEEDRIRRRARLDAVFFHLYGLTRDDAEYMLGTFPIVAREETERYGRFRSRDLILAYMAALAAGNPDAKLAG